MLKDLLMSKIINVLIINCDTLACEQLIALHDSIIEKAQKIQADLKYQD